MAAFFFRTYQAIPSTMRTMAMLRQTAITIREYPISS